VRTGMEKTGKEEEEEQKKNLNVKDISNKTAAA